MSLARCHINTSRNLLLHSVLACCLLLSACTVADPALSLPALENRLDDSREVEIATAELEERIYLLKRERLRRGIKLFANAGYMDVSAVVTNDLQREYQRKHMTMGISYPLFGTQASEKNAVLEAENGVFSSAQRRIITRNRALATLRRSYVDYWAAIQRLKVSAEFLSIEESTRHWLFERTNAGHLLEADRLEFMIAFDLARRASASDKEIRTRSHSTMALLTDGSLAAFAPASPRLPTACLDKEALHKAALQQHPELKLLRARRDTIRSLRKRNNDVEGNVNLSTSMGRDEPSSLSDNGLAFSVNVRMPLEFLGTRKYSRHAKSAQLRRANLELDKRTVEVGHEIHSAIGHYQTAIENLNLAETRVAAALETVRERQLRAVSLPGNTLEKLQQAKFGSYRTSIDLIDAESLLLKATIALLALSEQSCVPPPPDIPAEPERQPNILAKPLSGQWASTLNLQPLVPKYSLVSQGHSQRVHYEYIMPAAKAATQTLKQDKTQPAKERPKARTSKTEQAKEQHPREAGSTRVRVRYENAFDPATSRVFRSSNTQVRKKNAKRAIGEGQQSTGIYVWKSKQLINDSTARETFWKKLKSRNINRVLLSLDGQQIQASKKGLPQQNLLRFLSDGKKNAIRIELLLGEPSWLLEAQRNKLHKIIQQLSELPFEGLHLDIEPGMFDRERFDRGEILKQLGDTIDSVATRSPWPISLSLHFRDLDSAQPYCLGCRLSELDVAEVALMIYVSNPKRVAEITADIAQQNPGLTFSVAQSVEPILSTEESYAHLSSAMLDSKLKELHSRLAPLSVGSILLQSWSDLEAMAL